MRPLVIRAVRSPVKWVFPLLAAWLFWIDSVLRRSGFPLWSEVAPSFLYSVLVLGPIAAAFTGLRAWTERRPSLSELTTTAFRDPAARQAVSLVGDIFWISAAQILVIGVTLATVAVGASWGEPDWGMLLASICALWACAGLGWGAGWLVPTRVTGPLTGLALYFVMGVALSIDLDFFRSILPLLPSGAPEALRPTETVSDWVGWLQVVWFSAVAVLGFGIAVTVSRRRLPVGLFGVGMAAILTAVVLLMSPGRHVDPEAPLVCDQGAIDVCTHPAYEDHLPDLANVIRSTIAPLVEAEVVPSRVVSDDYLDGDNPNATAIGFSPHPDAAFVAEDVAQSALRDSHCTGGDLDYERFLAWDFVARWLMIQGGVDPPVHFSPAPDDPPLFFDEAQAAAFERFEALGPEGQIAWLRSNYQPLVSCQVDLEEVG